MTREMSVGIASVTIVQRDVVAYIDPAGLAEAVDPDTYERGVRYARQHTVVRALWKLSAGALAGTVRGQYGNVYTTTARFSATEGAGHRFERGECSCPVGVNCKHVVALVLTATATERAPPRTGKDQPGRAGPPTRPGGRRTRPATGEGHPTWEWLASLLDTRTGGRAGTGAAARRPGKTPAGDRAHAVRAPVPAPDPPGRGPIRSAAGGPPRQAGKERLGGRRPELVRAEHSALAGGLPPRAHPVAEGVRRPLKGGRGLAPLLLRGGEDDHAVRLRVPPALAAAGRGRGDRPAAGRRAQAVGRAGALRTGRAMPRRHR